MAKESRTPSVISVVDISDSDGEESGEVEMVPVENNIAEGNKVLDTIYLSSGEEDSNDRHAVDSTLSKWRRQDDLTADSITYYRMDKRGRSTSSSGSEKRLKATSRRQCDRSERPSLFKKKHGSKRKERHPSNSSPRSSRSSERRRSRREERDAGYHFPKIEDVSGSPTKEEVPDFYCRDCQVSVNSTVTWKTHLAGQRHYKATKVRELSKIAKGSIQLTSQPRTLDQPRFGEPSAGMKRYRVSTPALLQKTVDKETQYPMPGLNLLREIHAEQNQLTYYCEICDAPCDMTTIMPHLIGSKHQFKCLKYVDTDKYYKIKRGQMPYNKKYVEDILFRDQAKHGKQRIKVFIDRPDETAKLTPIEQLYFGRPGPKWSTDDLNESENGQGSNSSVDKYLDTSKGDFCCTLCNSHMNNLNMWTAHMRGERHLKNEQKIPGESLSRVKSFKSDAKPKLLGLLKRRPGRIIVGLDYIRETIGPNGALYNCFLCGAGCTELDIVDHLLLTKHRIKYLEKMDIDGKDNTISLIKQLDVGVNARDSLVKEACDKLQQQYGSGRVEVHISKNVYR